MYDIKRGIVTITEMETIDEIVSSEMLRLVPTFVLLSAIFMFGSIGNGIVFYIYKTRFQRSNTRMFILFLSSVGFFACFIIVPIHAVTIPDQYRLYTPVLCKGSAFLDAITTVGTSLMLISIAFERYRKICKPFSRQMSLRTVHRLCMASVVTGVIIAIPDVFIYGQGTLSLKQYKLPLVECSTKDEMRHSILPLVNAFVYGLVFLVTVISMAIFYSLTICAIYKQAKEMHNHLTSSSVNRCRRQSDLTHRHQSIQFETNDLLGQCSIQSTNDNNSPFLYKVKFDRKSRHMKASVDVQTETESTNVHILKGSSECLNTLSSAERDKQATVPENLHICQKTNETMESEPDIVGSNTHGCIEHPQIDKQCSISEIQSDDRKSRKSLISLFSPSTLSLFNRDAVNTGNIAARKVSGRSQGGSLHTAARRSVTMMLVLSVTFIVSYIPVISLLIARNLDEGFVYNLNNAQYIVYKFFLRSYFVKFAANPVIYGICDRRFRRICKQIVTNCFVKCR